MYDPKIINHGILSHIDECKNKTIKNITTYYYNRSILFEFTDNTFIVLTTIEAYELCIQNSIQDMPDEFQKIIDKEFYEKNKIQKEEYEKQYKMKQYEILKKELGL